MHSRRLPGWALPAAGGTLAVIVGVLWYTSALWYYNGYQLLTCKPETPPMSSPCARAGQDELPSVTRPVRWRQ